MIAETATTRQPAPLDLWDVFHLFRSNRGKIAVCLLMAVGAAGCYLRYARPVYASRALLEVSQEKAQEPVESDSSEALKTIELKIADQSVLLGVVKAADLMSNPDFLATPPFERIGAAARRLPAEILALFFPAQAGQAPQDHNPAMRPSAALSDAELARRIRAKISVETVRGSRLISVTAEDHDPAMAQRLAQAVIDEFFRQSWSQRREDSGSSRALLMAEAKRVGGELKSAEERLQAYREDNRAVSLEERQNIVVERLRELNQQVAAAKSARLAMEEDRRQVSREADSSPELLLNISSIAGLPEIIDLRKEVALQEAHVATLAKRYGSLHPTMIQARGQLEEMRSALKQAIRKAGNLVVQSYQSAKATEEALETALAEQQKAALELDRIAIPYHALEREAQADTGAYQAILERLQQSNVTNDLISSHDVDDTRVHVVERPLRPIRPVRPRAGLWMGAAAAAGLFLGCGAALASRALDDTFTSVDGAEALLGLPVLVSVPRSPHKRLVSGPVVVRRPASAEAEAFRSLRTSISLIRQQEEGRSILFTSAVPEEGKSYCSLNFAAALAQQGFRTLLIDGDLRRPHLQQISVDSERSSLQRLLAPHSARRGLSDCLRQPDLFPELVRTTSVPNLHVLGDTTGKPGGAELLGRNGMKDVLERALAAFDRVVIDSAPLIAVSDTLHIAKNVSTVCLVIHAGKTPRRLVRRACRMLDEVAQRTPVGIVLNKISRGSAAGYHYYYSDKAYA